MPPSFGSPSAGLARTEVAAIPSTMSSPVSFMVIREGFAARLRICDLKSEKLGKNCLRGCCQDVGERRILGIFILSCDCLLNLANVRQLYGDGC
jgi:hypothetical protein